MKTLLATRYVDIPDGVTLEVKSRVVTVTGPRGVLVQSFKHVNLDMQLTGKGKLRVDLWFGNRKQVSGYPTSIFSLVLLWATFTLVIRGFFACSWSCFGFGSDERRLFWSVTSSCVPGISLEWVCGEKEVPAVSQQPARIDGLVCSVAERDVLRRRRV